MRFVTLLSLMLLVAFTQRANAQVCVIDTGNYSLITPAADELPCIERTKNYQIVLQFYSPPALAGFTIDSIKVTSFTNMPTGISTLCTPITCTMPGNGRACVTLYGNTLDTVGTYNIVYNGFVYTSQGTAPFSYIRQNLPGALPDYYLDVIEPNTVCRGTTAIANESGSPEIQFNVIPNPSTGLFNIEVKTGATGSALLRIADASGKIVYTKELNAIAGFNSSVDLSSFSKGLYFAQLQTAEGFSVRKILVE